MDVIRWAITVIVSVIVFLPVLYAFSVSLRPRSEVFGPVHLIPYEPTIEPYLSFFADSSTYLVNSLLVATGVSMLILLIAIPGAYAFGRLEFKGRKGLFYAIVMIVLVPEVMLIVPVAQIVRWLHLFDTIAGLWLALLIGGMPIAIWILRDNFMRLPPNAEEAAMVYGCTQFSAFRKVVLPLATPAIITVAFLSFLSAWTEFLFTNMLSTPGGGWTAIVVLFSLMNPDHSPNWPLLMAASFIVSLPPIVFYGLIRRTLQEALNF
ncbi:carbohydrate ABC transporter permease [Haladaptatus sp. GCM10025893]